MPIRTPWRGSAEGGEAAKRARGHEGGRGQGAAKMTRGTQGGRYREGPGRSASSERQFGCAIWNSVTKKAGFWLPMGFAESSVTKKAGFWLPMRFEESSVTKKAGFLVTDGVRRRVGAAVERSPKVILQPLGVWKAHRITWSVNGVISHRGPFTLEAHRWPFCGNGVGHEITPFTPEPLGRPKCGQNPKPGSRACPVGGLCLRGYCN